MKRNRKIQLALASAVALCTLFSPENLYAEVVDGIAAVVNNTIITDYELGRAMAARAKGAAKSGEDTNLRQETLARLIDEALLGQILDKSKIEVTDDDMARAVANVLQRNRMSIDQLKSEIAAKGMTYEEYKKGLAREIRRVKLIGQVIGPQVKISDQDLRDFYQQNQERFRGSHRAHIAEIILPLDNVASQAEMDKLGELAMSITSKARRGSNFAQLAKEYSKGPNASEGGDMGFVNLKDLTPQVADATRGLRVGDIGGPVLTQNAIIIVKIISLPEIAGADFEKYRDEIYGALYDEKMEETLRNYLQRERERAFVEIR